MSNTSKTTSEIKFLGCQLIFGDCGALGIIGTDGLQGNKFTPEVVNEYLKMYTNNSKIVFASVRTPIWEKYFKPFGWKEAISRKGNYPDMLGEYRIHYIYFQKDEK